MNIGSIFQNSTFLSSARHGLRDDCMAMTLDELLASDNRNFMEELLLWVIEERYGATSWIYRAYSRNISKFKFENIKAILEVDREKSEQGLDFYNSFGFL